MKVCPTCKRTNVVEDDNFCYRDGTPLVEQLKCRCGREINQETDLYCSHCGRNLREDYVTKFVNDDGGPSDDLDSSN